MNRKKKRFPDAALLVLLIGFGAVLGHLQTNARNGGKVDLPSEILQRTINPVAMPLAKGLIAMDDFASGVLRAHSLVLQNERLRAQMIALDSYDDRVNFLKQQVAQLRAQLGYPAKDRQPVNLDVIGVSQLDGLVILDGGSEKGIRPDLPVVNGDGLVGIIQSVSNGQSRVALLTSYGVKVGGVDASRQPPEDGLISGLGSSTLTMLMFEPKAPVNSGDLIITSGQSQNIPSGLVIGRVISVAEDQFYGTRRLTIDPAVNLGLMHEAQVLK